MQVARTRSRTRKYRKNPYRKSKLGFLKPYIPRGIFWTTYKFRTQLPMQCDGAGNINTAVGAWQCYGNPTFLNLTPYFEAFKVITFTAKIEPNASIENALGGTPFYAAITHLDLNTLVAADYKKIILSSRDYRSMATNTSQKFVKVRWICDPNDGDENQFTRISSGVINSSSGGVLMHFDGPAAMAGQVPLFVTVTYYGILRGQGCAMLAT